MATTFIDYNGDGNATKSFSFPSIQQTDVHVDVDGVVKTAGVHYNITGYTTTGGGNVVFTAGNIPTSSQLIRIFRDTNVDSPKATYTAGSSVKAADLNANQEQLLFAAQEEQNQTVQSQDIKDGAITTVKLLDLNVTEPKLATDSVTTSKIVNDNVTIDKIEDAELKVLSTMQPGTAAKLASSTALTSDIADLNQIDGLTKQAGSNLSDTDTSFPTSAAVVSYVAAQLAPIGGFEAVADETSFPDTQPQSGVVISIANAEGLAVSGTGTASATTVGGTTVNISGIPSNFHNSNIAAGIRLLVSSTGSGQNYTYHKATLAEEDLVNLSGQINDFGERYRVGSTNPTTGNDNGDLFFNTSSQKLLVFDSILGAYKETQAIGNFSIETLSPAFNGVLQDFTITNPPSQGPQQILLSINGVLQKPNAGSSTPSEGFALSGSTIKLSSPPPTGSTYFAVVMGSSVGIGTPSNNTVDENILQNLSVSTDKIQDQAVTLAKLPHGTSSNDGKFLRANNGADPTFETVDTNLLADQSPQLGGHLDTNGYGITTSATNGSIQLTPDGTGKVIVSGAGGNDGTLQLNCSANTHGVKIKSPPHSAAQSYTLTLPVNVTANYLLTTDANGQLSWTNSIDSQYLSGALPAISGASLTDIDPTTANGCIYENNKTITSDFTTSTTKNSMSAGPITVDTGVTLTIPSGSFYTIV